METNLLMDVFYWKTSIIFKTPTKHLNYHGVKHATSKSETRVKPQDWLTEAGRSSTTCVTTNTACSNFSCVWPSLGVYSLQCNDDHPSLPQNGGV